METEERSEDWLLIGLKSLGQGRLKGLILHCPAACAAICTNAKLGRKTPLCCWVYFAPSLHWCKWLLDNQEPDLSKSKRPPGAPATSCHQSLLLSAPELCSQQISLTCMYSLPNPRFHCRSLLWSELAPVFAASCCSV